MSFQVQIPQNTTLSIKTDLEGVIISVNDDFVKLSEYTRKELLGQSFKRILDSKTPALLYKSLQKTLEENEPWNGIL
ncbi:PAS domain-containing protein [Leptospira montravelensis]|nr:PAS domain-containing protein [Leptospira montravelensis]